MRRHGTRPVTVGDGQGLAPHVLGHFAHQKDVAVVGIDGNGPAAAETLVQQRGFDAGGQGFVVRDGVHEALVIIETIGAVGAAVEGRQGGQQQNKGRTSHNSSSGRGYSASRRMRAPTALSLFSMRS